MPTDVAFSELRPEANEFLFHSQEGPEYLCALLEYHTIPDYVLFLTLFYQYF
jgi:hypothetical protein